MFKDSGEVLHFSNPKVQASLASNIFAISGQSETKRNLLYTISFDSYLKIVLK